MKLQLNDVTRALPNPPHGQYSYTVERVSPMVIKVWLNCYRNWDYKLGEPSKTIYCFVKGDMVHAPKSKDKMRIKPLCHISELTNQSPYSTIVPEGPTNLWYLQ